MKGLIVFLGSVVYLHISNAISENAPDVTNLEKGVYTPAFWKDRFCHSIGCWNLESSACEGRSCLKRATQEDMGPFWANRGKRDPTYKQDKFFADEPRWILVRRDEDATSEYDPFFLSRGKKKADHREWAKKLLADSRNRSRRELLMASEESPFFAARGKRDEDTEQ